VDIRGRPIRVKVIHKGGKTSTVGRLSVDLPDSPDSKKLLNQTRVDKDISMEGRKSNFKSNYVHKLQFNFSIKTSRMASMGAGWPVKSSNCRAAWLMNNSLPGMTLHPANLASRKSLVSSGL
jgi:hypothetical protein